MKKNSGSYLMVVVCWLALASCSSKTDSQGAEQAITPNSVEGTYELSKKQFEASAMKLGKLEVRKFHERVKATGMFDVPPENKASVSSYYGGTVKNLKLLPGERVKKGQLLFTLENPDFVQMQQEFLEAKGQLTYLKSDYERQKNLAQDNVSSQKSFLKAESDYQITQVKVASMSKKLTLMKINPNTLSIDNIRTTVNITSPINGFVTQVDITTGAFLNPSQSAITIVDTDHLHIELNIFEKDLPKVGIGQSIRFSIQEDRNRDYAAVVHLVNKTVDPQSRTIGIHGHLSDEKSTSLFTPGMYVEADIYSTSVSKTALPEDALVEIDDQYYALVLQRSSSDGYSFMQKEIITGESSDGFIEILNLNDFNDNTQFLVKGTFNLITE